MADIGMAAFSTFFMQSPSFLNQQRQLLERTGRSNAGTLFAMDTVPCDNHIRTMLDGIAPDHFDPVFDHILDDLDRCGGLDQMRCLDRNILIALDGSEYFCSRKINCDNCSHRLRSDGETEFFHTVLASSIVAPGHATVLPLQPEFVRPQDGAEKQDCERQVVKRWMDRFGARHADLRPVCPGDDLYACQPVCEAVAATGGSYIYACKPASHKTLYEYLQGVDIDNGTARSGKKSHKRIFNDRWINQVPLRDGKDALHVNWLEVVITKTDGTRTYRNSFITDKTVTARNVAEIARCGRTRWDIEKGLFNVGKRRGYHFGHGKDTLASLLMTLNLIAFAMHSACEMRDELWQKARRQVQLLRALANHILHLRVVGSIVPNHPDRNTSAKSGVGVPPGMGTRETVLNKSLTSPIATTTQDPAKNRIAGPGQRNLT